MDAVSIAILVATILLLAGVVVLIILLLRSGSNVNTSGAISSLYALGKTVFDAMKDGKLEKAEITAIWNDICAVIAALRTAKDGEECTSDKVMAEFTE